MKIARTIIAAFLATMMLTAALAATGCGGASNTDSAKVGDLLVFGNYEGKPIEWQVLAVENGKAFVVTKGILDVSAYNEIDDEKDARTTWEECSLRTWLNGGFLNSAFSSAEKAKIVDTKVVNADNPEYKTSGGNDTTDKIFLLSIDEANKYFNSDSARVAKLLYSSNSNSEVTDSVGDAFEWWLRSPGHDIDSEPYKSSDNAATVDENGRVRSGLYVGNQRVGIRPALWLNL